MTRALPSQATTAMPLGLASPVTVVVTVSAAASTTNTSPVALFATKSVAPSGDASRVFSVVSVAIRSFRTFCGRFGRAQLIERCKLTRCETEVFRLFAAERDSGYIREKLCISRDTAHTYLKHVYQNSASTPSARCSALSSRSARARSTPYSGSSYMDT